MTYTILIVEDEIALRETLSYNLEHQGYEVETVGDGKIAIETVFKIKPALIILDLMLPGVDGFAVTRAVRKEMNVPILMLTARDDEIDRVMGLEIGADDYMSKPFSMRELLARVKAMLRRVEMIKEDHSMGEKDQVIIFDNLEMDLSRHELRLNGEPVLLKPKEYELLQFFLENRGRVLSRKLILERVWGWDFVGGTRTVDVHTRWLREKIEDDPRNPTRIITVRGAGYRFEG
ncbi:MAG: response regulator transcription factor [Anaerolineaceae bacterium]|nr:response regulator transcription factor [Anaerolineaceae bacterium]